MTVGNDWLAQFALEAPGFFVGRAVRATRRRPWLVGPARTARFAILLRSRTGRHRFTSLPASFAGRPGHPCPVARHSVARPVSAFATLLLTHVRSFGQFDEITDLVENAPALALPDFRRGRLSVRCDVLSQFVLKECRLGLEPVPFFGRQTQLKRSTSASLAKSRSNVASGMCPAFLAISSAKQSENSTFGYRRK